MTVRAVLGPAGSGKTYTLIDSLKREILKTPLKQGQRVLALTFMHGARHRLNEKLYEVDEIRNNVECSTIDSFCWRLRRRWRSMGHLIGLPPPAHDDFEAECNRAAVLLERTEVNAWVFASHPIVIVDEAQDLRLERLRVVRALAGSACVLVAADEFQCLDQTLRPNPLAQWLPTVCEPETLGENRRTRERGLIDAAIAIRSFKKPVSAGTFRIYSVASAPMAAAYLTNAIAWSRGGSIAVLTPALKGDFARDVVDIVSTKSCGKQQNGPYHLRWERTFSDEFAPMVDCFAHQEELTFLEACSALKRFPSEKSSRIVKTWLEKQLYVNGRSTFTRTEIISALRRRLESIRNVASPVGALAAMTVSQAKNREFEGVVVLWPYQTGGDDEHKSRLLYNAVTRSKRWCTVLVQGSTLPNRAPFFGDPNVRKGKVQKKGCRRSP